MIDPLDEDVDLRITLAALGPAILRELQDMLTWPDPRGDALLRSLVGRVGAEPIAQVMAIADSYNVARLRLLRAMGDIGR